MEGTALDVILFVAATFTAGLVAGLTGFAFGLVAGAVWLHIPKPLEVLVANALLEKSRDRQRQVGGQGPHLALRSCTGTGATAKKRADPNVIQLAPNEP